MAVSKKRQISVMVHGKERKNEKLVIDDKIISMDVHKVKIKKVQKQHSKHVLSNSPG